MNLGWEQVHARFPNLCEVLITGYPSPRENEAGHDLTYQAEVGLVAPPNLPRTLAADMTGALQANIKCLELLFNKLKAGVAGYAEVSLQ